MNILVVYATKTNTVRDCIEILKKHLPTSSFTLFDINVGNEPNISDYDFIIIGSPIRMNKINKNIRTYMKKHENELLQKNTAYFFCCAFSDCFGNYINKNIPKILQQNAVEIACFGGRLDIEHQKGFDKIIVKMVRSDILGGGNNGEARNDECLPTVLESNISQFAEIIRNKIKK